MKKLLILSVFLFANLVNAKAQNGSLSFKVGVLNSITKTQQIDPTYPFTFAGFDSRKGAVAGLRYSYKLSRYFRTGAEFQYLLKGHASDYPTPKTLSYHYLGLSPFITFHPFANSKNKYISNICPEISLDYNHSLGTNANWDEAPNAKFYKSEIGYSLKLTYQPTKVGIEVFHFRPFTPFLKTKWGNPPFDDLKFNFVYGVAVLYKF